MSEAVIPLDDSKQVSVRRFQGKTLVDIREFYVDKTGEKKPGRKGIALSPDLWRKLLAASDDINAALYKIDPKAKSSETVSDEDD